MGKLTLVLEIHGKVGTYQELEAIKTDMSLLLQERWRVPYLSTRIEEREEPPFPGEVKP